MIKRRLILASLILVVLENKDAMENMPRYNTVPAVMIKKNQSTIYNKLQKFILHQLIIELIVIEISQAFGRCFEEIYLSFYKIF